MIKPLFLLSSAVFFSFLTTEKTHAAEPITSINFFSFLPLNLFQNPPQDKGSSPNRVYVAHLENKGLGFSTGYSSVGALLGPTHFLNDFSQFLVDARAHVFNDGKAATNVGIGERFKSSGGQIFGINAFYDYRQDLSNCNQVGIGFEMFSCYTNVVINGYVPVGNNSHRGKAHRNVFDEFIAVCRRKQRALPGIDAEISTSVKNWLPCNNWNMTGAIGPYYYHKKCGEEVIGGRFRATFQYLDYLTLETRVTYDHVYGGIVQGVITLSYPIGKAKLRNCTPCSAERVREVMLQPIQRNEIIVTRKHCSWKANF